VGIDQDLYPHEFTHPGITARESDVSNVKHYRLRKQWLESALDDPDSVHSVRLQAREQLYEITAGLMDPKDKAPTKQMFRAGARKKYLH
jgi:hypothetical protein